MAVRLSGLISGMDTDSLVQELVSAYSTKKDNYVKAQTKLEWKQDAWKSLNTKIYKFYSGNLSSMRYSSGYTKKTATSSNTSKATVTGSTSAVIGSQSLKISALAKSGYLTGAKVNSSITNDSKLSDFGVSDSSTINVTVNGVENSFEISADTTVKEFTSQLKEAGVSASFDATNHRFFISSKTSGADNDFSVSASSQSGIDALKGMGIYSISSADISSYQTYANYTDATIANLSKNKYLDNILKKENSDLSITNNNLTKEIATLNDYSTFAGLSDKDKETKLENVQKVIDEYTTARQKLVDEGGSEAEIKAYDEKIAERQSALTKYNEIKDQIGSSDAENYKDILKTYTTGISDTVEILQKQVTANNDIITANNTVIDAKYTDEELGKLDAKYADIVNTATSDNEDYQKVYNQFVTKKENAQAVLDTYDTYKAGESVYGSMTDSELAAVKDTQEYKNYVAAKAELGLNSSAVRIEGQDASITLNGAEFTSNTNAFQVNGLTITAQAITNPDEELTITTSDDVDGIYNMVKDFFKDYNTLINEMDSLYNATSSGKYEPLTDDEKESMSDSAVDKWETKIKDALLRRDDTLDGVVSALKNSMASNYSINGKNYSLASFGVGTLSYFTAGDNEKGAYHIDGDSDDSATSGNTDKLRAAIAADPDTFVSFFTQLSKGVYKALDDKMKSSSMSSAYTVYNDKSMKTQYSEYTTTIKEWETKISDMEDKYYKQFSAMESALSTLQSNSSALSSILGS